MLANLTALDAFHIGWTCALVGWTLWMVREHRRARGIVAAAEARARARDIEAHAAARRVVAEAVQRALRLGDRGVIVGRLR